MPSVFRCSEKIASASQIASLVGCGIGAVVRVSRFLVLMFLLVLGVFYFLVIVKASMRAGITKKQKSSRAAWSWVRLMIEIKE